MSSDRIWPVVVVGAGPTGLTLANLLARYGVDVLLIERNESTVQEPRAVSIDDESLRTMQAIGVVETVLSHVVPGYGSDYFSPRGSLFLQVRPSSKEYGYPKRNAFRQPIFERQLREFFCAHAEKNTRSEAWFGTELIDFREQEDHVTLTVRRPDGGTRDIAAQYVAACDGGRSFVREKLGIQLSGSTFRERWLILDLEETTDPTRDTKVFCDPKRPCLSLPGPDRTRRFEFMLHEGEEEAEVTSPEFIRSLLESHGEENTPIRRSRVYTFHARMADRWRQGRLFLAGDAAHLSPPFAGQGMNSGIRDAHNLAWKLAAVATAKLGPGLLDTYEEERRNHAWSMIQLALRMGKVMMPRSAAGAFGLQAAFRLLGLIPPARTYFAEMRYKPKPRFQAGFLVRAGNSGAPQLVGRLFPQPEVQSGNQSGLLDDFLGPGFALLALPRTPLELLSRFPVELFDMFSVRQVAIRFEGGVADAPQNVVKLRNESGWFWNATKDLPPGLFLIRPDRYVAAFLRIEKFDSDLQATGALIERTWR